MDCSDGVDAVAVVGGEAREDGADRMGSDAAVGGEARRADTVQLGVEARVDGGSVMSREAAVGVETLGGRGDGGHQGEQADGLGGGDRQCRGGNAWDTYNGRKLNGICI